MARAVTRLAIVGAAVVALAACASGDDRATIEIRRADDVQVVPADEAARLLADGSAGAEGSAATVPVVESSRSFQTRLGRALVDFNGCLQDRGFTFVGLPGESDDPTAADPGYVPALIACNNESGIAAVLQEQNSRQGDLTADDIERLNTDAQEVFECLLDRGWAFGELEPNENGVLTPSSFPSDIGTRGDELNRDLDACGWNDLDLG